MSNNENLEKAVTSLKKNNLKKAKKHINEVLKEKVRAALLRKRQELAKKLVK